MSSQHTPTPYRIDNDFIVASKNDTYRVLATTWEPSKDVSAKANAEFIILACNLHDELVEALKLARSFLIPQDQDLTVIEYLDDILNRSQGKE